MNIELTKPEIELLRHCLYVYREMVRTQERLALECGNGKSKRDADRFGKIIKASLVLDSNLSDIYK